MKAYNIGKGVSLPAGAKSITSTYAMIGNRGSGKTYLLLKLIEEFLAQHAQCVFIDPQGVGYGLRLKPDGKPSGLPIVIFGGAHGDVAITEKHGAAVAQAIVMHNLSAVIDVSDFDSNAAMVRFLAAFFKAFFKLKQKHPSPVFVGIDEAHVFAPQQLPKGEDRGPAPDLLSAVETCFSRGRRYGIGGGLATQRCAKLNKNVLNNVETLFVGRTTLPQDMKVIKDWLAYTVGTQEREDLLAGIQKLQQGNFMLWSPQFLERFDMMHGGERKTLDTSATPDDLAAPTLHISMVGPKGITTELLADLRSTIKLDAPPQGTVQIQERIVQERVEVPVLVINDEERQLLGELLDLLRDLNERHAGMVGTIFGRLGEIPMPGTPAEAAQAGKAGPGRRGYPEAGRNLVGAPKPIYGADTDLTLKPGQNAQVALVVAEKPQGGELDAAISAPQLKLLVQLYIMERIGFAAPSKVELAVFAGQSHKGGGFNNYLSALRTAGAITGKATIELTPAGRAAVVNSGPIQLPTSNAQIQEFWMGKLAKPHAKMLQAIIDRGRVNGVTKQELADALDMAVTGGGFNNYVSALAGQRLIIRDDGVIRASAMLFPFKEN